MDEDATNAADPTPVAPSAARVLLRKLKPLAIPGCIALAVLAFYSLPLFTDQTSIQGDAADVDYPLQKYFSDRFLIEIPFWTPYIYSGYPILANPELAAWYPPNWPFFLTGITPYSLQCELALNTFLACLGAYFVMLRMVERRGAAMLGAFAYAFSGFFAAHSSHPTVFAAAACFPWLLFAFQHAFQSFALRYTALGWIAGGAMLLAGYRQTAVYGFLGLALFAAGTTWQARRGRFRAFAIVVGMVVGSITIAAVQLLPAWQLGFHSVPSPDYTVGALRLKPLLTLAVPNAMGTLSNTDQSRLSEHYFYAGMLLLPLAAIGVLRFKSRAAALAVIVPIIWYAFGPKAGLYWLISIFPGPHKLGPLAVGWFLPAFGLALLAAAGAQWIVNRWKAPAAGVALAVILLGDAWYWNSFRNPLAYARASFDELYGAQERLAGAGLAHQQLPLSRFEAPRFLAGTGPILHPLDLRFETTYGYFILEPALYHEYLDALRSNPKLRDGLNVSRYWDPAARGVAVNTDVLPRAYFPKSVVDVGTEDESRRALETLDPSARSTVMLPHEPIRQDPEAIAFVTSFGEQFYRIRYEAASPSLLKLSVAWFPGWQAHLEHRELPIVRVDHALIGVVVPEGKHEVEFRYRSDSFRVGATVSLLTLAAMAGLIWLDSHERKVRSTRHKRWRRATAKT